MYLNQGQINLLLGNILGRYMEAKEEKRGGGGGSGSNSEHFKIIKEAIKRPYCARVKKKYSDSIF